VERSQGNAPLVLMQQSGMSGTVNGIVYRHFLQAQLTTCELIVRTSVIGRLGWELLRIPVDRIQQVKQIRFLLLFGLKIYYVDENGKTKTMKWYTWRHKRWAYAFESVGISVQRYQDWFDWF
jgi:hypothetical protein